MLIRPRAIVSLTIAMAFSRSAWSYDASLAESYAALFAHVKGAEAAKTLHLMKPGVLICTKT
jgi:hypothetical protein